MKRKVGMRGWRLSRAPHGNRSFVTLGPQELLRCYLGLAGAEVPYANSSLLSEEKILQMALCNLL